MSDLAGRFETIEIGLLVDSEWNPNKMRDREFDRLVKEIEETGMIDPIQVVEIEGGKYRIIGGHHRKAACALLGYATVPCIVLTGEQWKDEDRQKLQTVRMNAIRGRMSGEKMLALFNEVAEKHGADAVADLMGYTDVDAFNKMIASARKSLRDAGVPKEALDEFDNTVKARTRTGGSAATLDSLGDIIAGIHEKYGDTLNLHFLYFDWGGKKHLQVEVSSKAFKAIERMMKEVKKHNIDAGDFFEALAKNWRNAVSIDGDEDEKPVEG